MGAGAAQEAALRLHHKLAVRVVAHTAVDPRLKVQGGRALVFGISRRELSLRRGDPRQANGARALQQGRRHFPRPLRLQHLEERRRRAPQQEV